MTMRTHIRSGLHGIQQTLGRMRWPIVEVPILPLTEVRFGLRGQVIETLLSKKQERLGANRHSSVKRAVNGLADESIRQTKCITLADQITRAARASE
jgi:hypothetical protein